MIKNKLALFGFVAMTALGSVSLSSARAAEITGAGSSFAAPIYGAWGAGAKI